MSSQLSFSPDVFHLVPNLVERVWGGRWIADFKGIAAPSIPVGEAWEFSGLAEHPSVIAMKDGGTRSVLDLIQQFPVQVLGDTVVKRYGTDVSILVKLIDAKENLSLQVHPSDAYARRHENSFGKSESWLILDAGQSNNEGFIYLGFNPGMSARFSTESALKAAFQQALQNPRSDELLSFLNKIRVRAGNVFHVPPGIIHAIGRGVQLFEIQQSSGVTYRVWDWNRGRELNIPKAMDVLNFEAVCPVAKNEQSLRDPLGHYVADLILLNKTGDTFVEKGRGVFSVITALDGQVACSDESVLRQGHSVLIPAAMGKISLRALTAETRLIKSVPLI